MTEGRLDKRRHTAAEIAPLSQAQQMIWAGNQIDPQIPVFNTAWRFDIPQEVDPGRFLAAIERSAADHDGLRLVIETDEAGQPVLRDTGGLAGHHETLSFASEEVARDWIERAVRKPFDLQHESVHSALIRLSERHWIWYLNQHHIMTDATTSGLVFQSVARAYAGAAPGASPSFLDHTRTEQDKIDTDNVRYWKDATAAAIPQPRLYGGSVDGTNATARLTTVEIGPGRMNRLNTLLSQGGFGGLSRQQAVYNFFATVLSVWMHRVSGEDQIPIGVIGHGRAGPSARQTVGCFIELFPLHLELAEGASFRAIHAHVVERSMALLRRATPGSSAARGLSHFNSVINVMPSRFEEWQGAAVAVEWLDTGYIDQRHAFRLNVMELNGSDGIRLAMAFNNAVFDTDRQKAAERHFLTLVDAFLENPDQIADHVPLATELDGASRLIAPAEVANDTPTRDVITAFEALVQEAPNTIAIHEGDESLTRDALAARMNAIAEALLDHGITAGDRIGVHLTRSADLVASVLAVLKIGGSFVLLDPSQAPARLTRIREQAGISVMLTEPDLSGALDQNEQLLDVKSLPDTPRANVPYGPKTNPAYIMFTSGSTGVPKGVVISRASLARYTHWASETFGGAEPACWALHSAIGFDLTITSIFAPIVSGGTLVVYREERASAALSVLDVFRENRVEIVKLTPAHLRLVLELPLQPGMIRALVLGGEALPVDLAKRALEKLGPGVQIFNEYGPTEATVGCMVHRFDPARDTGLSVPVGRPAADTSIYVLDAGLNPVPDHVEGDLYIAGPDRLAQGYLNTPEETGKVFVDDPFAGGKMYRSGDIASVCSDGTILYHGRADDQLKISGVRIEPAEIEAAVQDIDGVDQATVVLFDPEQAGRKLCKTCGVPRSLPNVCFVGEDLCKTCAEFETYRAKVDAYFGDLDELREIMTERARSATGDYDCVMLLSGGKDSTYALSQLSKITKRVLAATLDNGFISQEAKKNIEVITQRLGIDHRFVSTPAMNEIFVDSLKRHANVCNGCFKTIYTLSLHLAKEVGAPTVVTGLSRGQLFETRLAPELFEELPDARKTVDDMVIAARRSYHAFPDVAAQKLNGSLFDQGDVLEEIAFVDFYRYCDVPVSEVYRHLQESVGWSRPMDTGRSTNCLINDVGIQVHKIRRGHHNYALPYSWDVRLGHKTRDEAVDELNDEIDNTRVQDILNQIGFDEAIDHGSQTDPQLVLYFAGRSDVSSADIRRKLLGSLPREMVPRHICQMDRIPLTPNGKIDKNALPAPDLAQAVSADADAGTIRDLSKTERGLIEIWRRVLGKPSVGPDCNFYDIGGDSLAAIQIATQCAKAGLSVTPQDIFQFQSVASVAAEIDQTAQRLPPPGSVNPPANEPRRPALSGRNKARLEALFGKKSDG